MPEFYPDIYEYLDSTDNASSVSAKGLEELIYKVRAGTGLDYDIASDVVRYFFQEVRNAMLRGEVVSLKDLGKFLIFGSGSERRAIIVKFKPFKRFSKKLNE